MKLFLLTFIVAVASASPYWDETGKYRILADEDLIKIEEPKSKEPFKVIKIEPSLDYYYAYPYYRYYQTLSDPEYSAIYALADPIYARYYNYYRMDPYYENLEYRVTQPFVYDYKLVKDIDA